MSNRSLSIQTIKDRVYVNMILQNNSIFSPTEIPVFPAQFSYELNDAIVDNGGEYYVAVESFTVSTSNIPLFIPDIQPNLPPYNNTDINKTVYSITLEYNGVTSGQIYVDFISQGPNVYVKPLSPFMDRYSTYYYVYTYTILCEMLNNALQNAWNALNGLIPLPTTDVPFFTYDVETSLFSLTANKNFYDVESLNPINIYCNYYLFELIYSFPNIYLPSSSLAGNGIDFQFYITNQYNNTTTPSFLPNPSPAPGDYYVITQNISTTPAISPMKSLFIATQMIPVVPQISPLPPVIQSQNPGIVNKLKVLEDIEPLQNSELNRNRNFIQYKTAKYSLIELNTTGPIQHLDISINWRDRFGLVYPVYLNNIQPANVRIVFIKKSSLINSKY